MSTTIKLLQRTRRFNIFKAINTTTLPIRNNKETNKKKITTKKEFIIKPNITYQTSIQGKSKYSNLKKEKIFTLNGEFPCEH